MRSQQCHTPVCVTTHRLLGLLSPETVAVPVTTDAEQPPATQENCSCESFPNPKALKYLAKTTENKERVRPGKSLGHLRCGHACALDGLAKSFGHVKLGPRLGRFQQGQFESRADRRCGHGPGAGRGKIMEILNQEYLAVAWQCPRDTCTGC